MYSKGFFHQSEQLLLDVFEHIVLVFHAVFSRSMPIDDPRHYSDGQLSQERTKNTNLGMSG